MSEVLPGAHGATRRARPTRERGSAPATLRAGAILVGAQVLLELAYVVSRDELTVVARVTLVLVVSAQLLLAWGALRMGAGAVLGLFVAELATALALVANGELATGLRVALALGTVAVVVLLALSLRSFPSPTITPRR